MDLPLDTFIAEARELLTVLESGLLKMDRTGQSSEALNEIFRAAHTIKGSAGLFGLDYIVEFTHDIENILDQSREGLIEIDPQLCSVLLKSVDHLSELIDLSEQAKPVCMETVSKGLELKKQLCPWVEGCVPIEADDHCQLPASDVEENDRPVLNTDECWFISWEMQQGVLKNGMDPLAVIKYLNSIGEVLYCHVDDSVLPLDLDVENLYLKFSVALMTAAEKSEIEDAFLFVKDDSKIQFVPPKSKIEQYIQLIRKAVPKGEKLGEILVGCGIVSAADVEGALKVQSEIEIPKRQIGEILQAEAHVPKAVVESALQQQKIAKMGSSKLIRVDAKRLDQLINLVGELVINQQAINLHSNRINDSHLDESVIYMMGLTEQVRDSALSLRMVAIGDTFQRFHRVVRDTASELGKKIELLISGEETELDRSVVEKLVDPLTHIIRNSIDHGIESCDEREAKNKPVEGVIKLRAFHESGNIVIEIEDDGRGIDTNRLRTKAIEKHIITEDQKLSQTELTNLIFHPGFSTAEAVTNLSGRGVGMDVVKRNIEELQGSIQVVTKVNVGTLLTLRLPMTMAIIDGFLTATAGTDFIVPKNTLVECIDFDSVEHLDGATSVNLRGDYVPYVPLDVILNLPQSEDCRKKLVIVQFGKQRAGILVDELIGEIQAVVKPLNPIFRRLKGVGGCSLLGSGDIAFILDVPQLIQMLIQRDSLPKRQHEVGYESKH